MPSTSLFCPALPSVGACWSRPHGFLGNELAARVRLRAGNRLSSPALVAEGKHAHVDGFVSLGVVASAALVGLGLEVGDPIVGLLITLVILKVTWDSWRVVRLGVHAG